MKIPHTETNGAGGMPSPLPAPSDVGRYFAVLAEEMACPVVQFGEGGRVLIANSLARPLLVESVPGGERRLLLADGREFWDVLAAEAVGGAPLLSGSASLRSADGSAVTVWYAGFPAVVREGRLSGAVVLVYDASDERLVSPRQAAIQASGSDELKRIASDLAVVLGAGAVLIAEIEADRPRAGRTLAAFVDGEVRHDEAWDLASSPAPSAPSKPLAVVPEGLAERYPEDEVALRHGYEAFAGILVLDRAQERIGVIGAYFQEPLLSAAPIRGVLRLFAEAVARELESMRAMRAVRESEGRVSALFTHGHLPILLVDPASTQIVQANPAACKMYGVPEDELVAMSIVQFAAESPEAVRAEVRSAARGDRDMFYAKQMSAGGEVRDFEVFAGPLEMGGRTLVYLVPHDVTEKRKAEAQLARYRQELEALVQRRTADLLDATSAVEAERERRSRLYSDLGAELKTPLQTILGLSEALGMGLAGELNAEQSRQVLMIGEAAKKLSALVHDALELLRLESGVAEGLRVEPFDLRLVAQAVAVSFQAEAAYKGIGIQAEVPELPVDVETDRARVEQILLELASNAVKYTEQGSVTIRVLAPQGGQARIEVSDTGIGIPSENLPHIFEEFRHLRAGDAGEHIGTGLGLALCRRLAEGLGGSIEVASTVGVGTTFTVRFPVRAPEPGPSA